MPQDSAILGCPTPRPGSDTTEKNTQSTTYSVVLGLVSEMSFIASGMKPPGFASVAPAATIAIHGDEAIVLILSTMLWARFGSRGRRRNRTTANTRRTAAMMSTTATQGLGYDVVEAALLPSTKAARTPTASVALSAPR
jgi:hypothetical protein